MNNAIRYFLSKFFDFRGRSNRSEHIVFLVVLFVAGALFEMLAVNGLVAFILFIPSILIFVAYIATLVRRMHDMSMSAWWLILLIIPLINIVFWLYLLVCPGKAGVNQYGEPSTEIDFS